MSSNPLKSIRALATLMRRHASDLQLTALHTITSLTGSLVLALALAEGQAEADEIWACRPCRRGFQHFPMG